MRLVADVAPPNSLVLVMDRSAAVIPKQMGNGLVAATPSCVAVGTLAQPDGSTRITLADEVLQAPADELVFDGVLETPARKVAVCSVLKQVILEIPVGQKRTRVRIWANHPSEPDDLRIMVSAFE